MPSLEQPVVAREHGQLVELEPDAVADEAHLRRAVAHEVGLEPVARHDRECLLVDGPAGRHPGGRRRRPPPAPAARTRTPG